MIVTSSGAAVVNEAVELGDVVDGVLVVGDGGVVALVSGLM